MNHQHHHIIICSTLQITCWDLNTDCVCSAMHTHR